MTSKIIKEIRSFILIILLGVAAGITFGILNDLITASICIEYFSEGFHKYAIQNCWAGKCLQKHNYPVVPTALFWGIAATWYVGLGLGIGMALTARIGRWPKLSARMLIVQVSITIALIGLFSFSIAFLIWISSDIRKSQMKMLNFLYFKRVNLDIFSDFKTLMNTGKRYYFCAIVHFLDYIIGGVFGGISVLLCIYRRYRLKVREEKF